MIRRTITKKELETSPYIKWNEFINLIAVEDYNELTYIQRVAQLCFYYDSEVQNGGHIQYFTNRKGQYLNETLEALKVIGAFKQLDIVSELINSYDILDEENINSRDEFIQKVLVEYDYEFSRDESEERFDELIERVDREFYLCKPTINDLLEEYLKKYEEEFISLI
ncbi:protein of unknown function [Clostridium cavendishii DSM 21758]|uniref:DNA mimic protein DMP19 C-terminal domain-containing protein n=1 Tax=Clostridium cavendishii DSM 21758 TaxID=1121302 RepID=A0A1M6NNJ4_9CLOT|nr:DUF4375 domain-containing protein [Clostridium cavendishii]SHJ97301.1 protein of unknown function [Clostridium cavendishii DSM 21758]